MRQLLCFFAKFDVNVKAQKNPSIKKGFQGGPTWARTKDPLIMSQML